MCQDSEPQELVREDDALPFIQVTQETHHGFRSEISDLGNILGKVLVRNDREGNQKQNDGERSQSDEEDDPQHAPRVR